MASHLRCVRSHSQSQYCWWRLWRVVSSRYVCTYENHIAFSHVHIPACSLGVAHPPGYPTFTMLARLAMVLFAPFGGTPAWRVNLMNAALGAAASACLYAMVCKLTHGNRYVALISSTLFAFQFTTVYVVCRCVFPPLSLTHTHVHAHVCMDCQSHGVVQCCVI